MLGIYTYYKDFGRMGELDGLFIADHEELLNLDGKTIYFGEVLGKHSEVIVEFSYDEDIDVRTQDQDFIKKFQEIMGENFSTGYSPLDFYVYEG